MGVVLARCAQCERCWRVVTFQAPGKRLRNRKSPCCQARLRRVFHHRPEIERP